MSTLRTIMDTHNYVDILTNTLAKMKSVRDQIAERQMELVKLRQFFLATMNMVPDQTRAEIIAMAKEADNLATTREKGLKDAIYDVLERAYPKFVTVTKVRDRLESSGFNFKDYTSNPLASISTTLLRMRRFDPKKIDKTRIDGVTGYRISDSAMRKIRESVQLGEEKEK